ncbi:MAG: glycosyltransferase, partial [Candidatus Cloacimonetes bacterium]|nr:glycosyltransferase [Candidatus Cloacimonadota bacterium]
MLKLTVITSEPFPYGGAATNRMLTYLPRLAKMGYSIELMSFSNGSGIDQCGVFQCGAHQGINYTCIRLKRNSKVVKRLVRYYTYAFLGIKTLLSARRLDPDIVLVVTNDSFLFVLGYLTAKRCRAKYVLEKSEFPFILLRAKSSLQKLLATMNIRIFYRLFDGMLVMTKALKDFLAGVCRKNALLHHMPMTVDFERFARQESEKENWITYIGSFGAEKDGVGGLIDSFKLVSEKHDDWILVLIGDLVGDEAKILNDKIMKYGLLDRVILTGKISYDSVPSYLKKSRTLALSRPNTMQAHYGFPSKLGEYLAT